MKKKSYNFLKFLVLLVAFYLHASGLTARAEPLLEGCFSPW